MSIESRLDNIEKMLLAQKQVLTFDECIRYCGISASYGYKLTSKGIIPHSKPHGKIMYFNRAEVDSWLLSNPIKSTSQIESEAATYVTLNQKGGVK